MASQSGLNFEGQVVSNADTIIHLLKLNKVQRLIKYIYRIFFSSLLVKIYLL